METPSNDSKIVLPPIPAKREKFPVRVVCLMVSESP